MRLPERRLENYRQNIIHIVGEIDKFLLADLLIPMSFYLLKMIFHDYNFRQHYILMIDIVIFLI